MEEIQKNEEALETEEVTETAELTPEQIEELTRQKQYTPRPLWQIIAAWVGVAVVAAAFLLYCYHIATGGQ